MEMSDQERKAAEEEWSKITKDSKRMQETISSAQMALGAFGFSSGPFDGRFDEKTRRGILRYQVVRGLKQTSEIDFDTFSSLMDDFQVFHEALPYLPPLIVVVEAWNSGLIKATGTWILEGDEQAFPVQTTELKCYKEQRQCIEATA